MLFSMQTFLVVGLSRSGRCGGGVFTVQRSKGILL